MPFREKAELPRLGVSAISLGAPRGTLVTDSGRPVNGRLFGPSLLPQGYGFCVRIGGIILPRALVRNTALPGELRHGLSQVISVFYTDNQRLIIQIFH